MVNDNAMIVPSDDDITSVLIISLKLQNTRFWVHKQKIKAFQSST